MTKPEVIIFNAVSLDGRMDGGLDEMDMGLYYGLAARWNADAMLSGSNTMLASFAGQEDAPVEQPPGEKELHPLAIPYMVIVDSRGRIGNWRMIQAQPFWRETIALCSRSTPPAYLAGLERDGVPYIIAGDERVDFRLALEELNARFGIQRVRVDSGGVLNGILLRAGLVDEVSLLLGPSLVGGESPRSVFVAPDMTSTEQAIPLKLIHFEQVQENVLWLRYVVRH
jgi:2,5-diamino-6-(ribosylamino)-4(3H)-pyrimidinone 5'-phosphate reductase